MDCSSTLYPKFNNACLTVLPLLSTDLLIALDTSAKRVIPSLSVPPNDLMLSLLPSTTRENCSKVNPVLPVLTRISPSPSEKIAPILLYLAMACADSINWVDSISTPPLPSSVTS